ncbi:MAG: Zinc carboxypeptidase [Bacteroidetes bacterium]|nr:Zinc carboxypeptidase [Bacteroidota bacterium]
MKRILFILLFAATAHAQEALDFFPGGTYDPKIPPPKSVLGYSIGERFTEYAALNAYFDKLSASSDRIRRIAYGETNEKALQSNEDA